jgi:hypothetical protein
MALTRVWTPSPNYSGGGTKRLLVIHTMEGFTGPNGAYDCAKYFQGNVGCSSQVCIDNNRGKVWECVSRGNGAWTQCNYNSVSVSMEQCGYASWSRDKWLNEREPQLRNVADWIKEESGKLGIPITRLNASQAQGSGRGICGHQDLGSSGCGHSDPGANWPWDKVLEWAKGGGSAPPASGGVLVSSDVAFYEGKQIVAYIRPDGKVCCNGGVVDPGSNAKSGVGLAIDDKGKKVITYTNTSGRLCKYEQQPGSNTWAWVDLKWDAK